MREYGRWSLCQALVVLGVVGVAASTGRAQDTLFFCLDADERTWWNGNGLDEVGLLREDEVGVVQPAAGPYSAAPFLSMAAQWASLGDADGDGRYADDSTLAPGGDATLLFLRAGDPPPSSWRDLFLCKSGTAGFGPSLNDSDVFRYAGPSGQIEVFLRETEVVAATGQASSGSVDLDALCQSAAGDLFLSFEFTESVNGSSAEDGSLIRIPGTAITYDPAGNVLSIAAGSAEIVALESDLETMALNSGMRTSVGGAPVFDDLQGLEIDPAAGTWISPITGDTLPDLLFAWGGYSNDGAVLSTAAGGRIATLAGVPLASTTATTGQQIGMLPDSTGLQGLNGIAVSRGTELRPVVELYPRQLVTSLPAFQRLEIASATPNSLVRLYVVLGPLSPGGAIPSVRLSAGELFLDSNGRATPIAIMPTDGQGFASASGLLVDPALTGLNLCFQVLDLGGGKLSAPAALQFL